MTKELLTISTRSKLVPPSPIRKLVPQAEKAKKSGIKVFHLNIGQPDIPTPPEFFRAVADYPSAVLEYSLSQGNQTLLQKISEYYFNSGLSVQPEEIQVTTGGSEAILFAMFVTTEPGDEIIA